jgi:hypothetical protein
LLTKNVHIKLYRIIILPYVLYGFETWSVTLRQEQRLRVFGNRVLREVFGSKMEEVTWDWRRLDKEEPVPRLLRKFPVFYVTRRFITVFTTAGN